MKDKIGGQRPRPRVALLGVFKTEDVEHFERMFPTIWPAKDMGDLSKLVDVREIDLLVIASDCPYVNNWPEETHVVCFAKRLCSLPGPVPPNSYIEMGGNAETEEFFFPDVPLPLNRRREADYNNLESVRGWPRLRLRHNVLFPKTKRKASTTIFINGAIICEHHTNSPLAVYYRREDTGLGVGWLPSVDTNQAAWVELLVTQWAQYDKDAFPSFGDWTNAREWMVAEEEGIMSQIQALEHKKKEFTIEIDKQIGEWTTQFALAKANANKGQRRLITAQGEELVDEVAKALKAIGFNVTDVDQLIGKKGTRREDLRLGHSDKEGEDWNAIVEVRGYARSVGTTADLLRLNRFATLYERETGKAPDKRIYIVNGQLELLQPQQRQEPLASATEDLQIFAESDGLLIWSIDLFRAIKTTDPSDYPALLMSIKHAQGRWKK